MFWPTDLWFPHLNIFTTTLGSYALEITVFGLILHFSWSWGYLGPFDILDIKVALHFGALHFLREPLLRDLSISTRTQLICMLANLFSFRLGFAEAKKMSIKKIWVEIVFSSNDWSHPRNLYWPFCCYAKIYLWFVDAILSRTTFLDDKW
jgi:hypothetical protein